MELLSFSSKFMANLREGLIEYRRLEGKLITKLKQTLGIDPYK